MVPRAIPAVFQRPEGLGRGHVRLGCGESFAKYGHIDKLRPMLNIPHSESQIPMTPQSGHREWWELW